MKRFLSILLVVLAICGVCAVGTSAAAAKKGFNPDAIKKCFFLNDTTGITGYGHCGVVLVDENNYARLYNFQRDGLSRRGLTPAQLEQFLKDGLPFPTSQFQFNRVIIFNITPEEGRRMYDQAETHQFQDFNRETSFWVSIFPVEGDNCLTVARSITTAGSPKYDFLYPFGLPNSTFYTMQMSLFFHGVPYTLAYPEKPPEAEAPAVEAAAPAAAQ
ncbi:MAG: hypothetical protein FWC27_08040 [Firmicutes bacterium]|nr:hypothetical protein [Bacillota bacterium]